MPLWVSERQGVLDKASVTEETYSAVESSGWILHRVLLQTTKKQAGRYRNKVY